MVTADYKTSINMKPCASQKSSSLWRRPLAMQEQRAMISSQPPSERKSMCPKSNSRLTSWLFWQIRSSQGSLLPSLNFLRRTFVHSLEVIRGFLLPILESPAIAVGPLATSLHNVGSDLRRLAIFLQAVRVTTNPGRQLSRKIYPTPNLYKFGLY